MPGGVKATVIGKDATHELLIRLEEDLVTKDLKVLHAKGFVVWVHTKYLSVSDPAPQKISKLTLM